MNTTDNDIRARERFESLYADTRVGILGYFLRRVDDASDAADLLAEAYLVVWRRIQDVPPDDQARLWLYGVARRVLSNHRRHEKASSNLAGALKADLHGNREEFGDDGSPFGDVIEDAIQNLNGHEREIIELSAWEQLTPTEIATVIGMKPGAVRVRLHRARKAVGIKLTEAGYVPPARLRAG
jgi:RNA polymerase sigma factor (sigma-70 family)